MSSQKCELSIFYMIKSEVVKHRTFKGTVMQIT